MTLETLLWGAVEDQLSWPLLNLQYEIPYQRSNPQGSYSVVDFMFIFHIQYLIVIQMIPIPMMALYTVIPFHIIIIDRCVVRRKRSI